MKRFIWVEVVVFDKIVVDEVLVLFNVLYEVRGYDYLNFLVYNLVCSL